MSDAMNAWSQPQGDLIQGRYYFLEIKCYGRMQVIFLNNDSDVYYL